MQGIVDLRNFTSETSFRKKLCNIAVLLCKEFATWVRSIY